MIARYVSILSSRDYSRLDLYKLSTTAVVLLAIALRFAQYLYDRSLWMDEAFLALNIIDKPFSGLFGELGFNQAAPPGFLLLERTGVTVFGRSEYALRLFPLLFGISSIFLFKRLANILLDRGAALLALTLFSLSDALIYYSSEVKQYSAEVAITLLVAVAGLDLSSRRQSRRRVAGWCLVGSTAVWFSHAAAFAVAAVLVLLAFDVARRRWDVVKPTAVATLVWLTSLGAFLVYQRFTISHLLHSYGRTTPGPSAAASGGSDSFFPTGVGFVRNVAGALSEAFGIPATGTRHAAAYALAAMGVLGAVAIARRAARTFVFVAAPAVGVYAAAAIGLYPILPRTILFLVPWAAVVVARGVVASTAPLRRGRSVVTLGIAAALLAVTAGTAGRHLLVPREREEMKPVIRYLARQWKPGDSLYLFYRAQYAVRYYLECDCFSSPWIRKKVFVAATPAGIGSAQYAPALLSDPPRLLVAQKRSTLREYLRMITPLLGRKRVWFLATAVDPTERSLFGYLACVGRRRDSYVRRSGSGDFRSVVLVEYDLSSWRARFGKACGARFGL
jgi:4-amino-4-deoxy-L-arabinose transferase-like glycosyltransferase